MPKNILFDLDGTLVDSKKGIINSILYSLEKMNISEENPHELSGFIGPPLRESYMNRYKLSKVEGDQMVAVYREYYSNQGLFENELYDGVKELIENLKQRDCHIYLATSKPTIYAQQILEQHHLATYFEGVVGSNMDNTRTDKTEIISFLKMNFKVASPGALMIGDRKHDLIGARNNGLEAAGVTYGYGSDEELEKETPVFIARDRTELYQEIDNWILESK